MPKSVHDDARLTLVDLPLLTTRRACVVADCTRSTLQRSGPSPVGKRGRTYVYRTANIIAWLSSGLTNDNADSVDRELASGGRSPRSSAAAIARLRKIARGGAR